LGVKLAQQFRSANRHLVHEQFGAGAMGDKVFIEARITRNHRAAVVVLDAIAEDISA
jgi:hypothetical protein